KVSENIARTLWTKFVFLAPMSGMTALTRGPIGPVRGNSKSRAVLQAAVEEAVALGLALKTGLVPEDAARTMKLVDSLPPAMTSSMCHDVLADKPSEVEGLSGAVARLGQEHGVAAPTNAFIAAVLAPFTDGKPQA